MFDIDVSNQTIISHARIEPSSEMRSIFPHHAYSLQAQPMASTSASLLPVVPSTFSSAQWSLCVPPSTSFFLHVALHGHLGSQTPIFHRAVPPSSRAVRSSVPWASGSQRGDAAGSARSAAASRSNEDTGRSIDVTRSKGDAASATTVAPAVAGGRATEVIR